jgi:membrane-associated phospholipid phosphatase
MFETDLVIGLQSIASGSLTMVMVTVSALGERHVLLGFAILVAFGYNLRIGLGLVHMVLWNGVLTNLLKDIFALPRPAGVDATITLMATDESNTSPFIAADGDDFFDLPEPEAIEHYRSRADANYGFPSGHVSGAATLGTGAWILMRSRTLGLVASVFVVAMAFSRLYLGRHFLADVLGGLLVGCAVAGMAWLVLRSHRARAFTPSRSGYSRETRNLAILALVASSVPIMLVWIFAAPENYDNAGRLAGATIATAVLTAQRLPRAREGLPAAVGRVAIVVPVYVASTVAIPLLTQPLAPGLNHLLAGMLPPIIYLLGSIQICLRLGLYVRASAGCADAARAVPAQAATGIPGRLS